MRISDDSFSIVDRLIGGLLCLVGLGFITLFFFLKLGGLLTGDFKVSAFMIGCGVLLLWIGANWLAPKAELTAARRRPNLDRYWLALRRPGEALAVSGCGLMSLHVVGLVVNKHWLPDWLLWAVVVGPVVLACFIVRILVPGAFPSHVFARDAVLRWSAATRLLVNSISRIGWFGHIAILFLWFGLDQSVPREWRLPAQVLASWLISVLFALQWLQLHYGEVRRLAPGSAI